MLSFLIVWQKIQNTTNLSYCIDAKDTVTTPLTDTIMKWNLHMQTIY